MNYVKTAEQIYQALGKSNNIESLSHCMTRLRIVLKDDSAIDDNQVKNIDGVIGVNRKNGQYQIIIGHHVKKCYQALLELTGNLTSTTDSSAPKKKINIFEYLISIIAGSMSPIIPAILGGGMIKVLVILLTTLNIITEKSNTHNFLSLIGDAPFYFLPIMLAFSAAIKFNVTPMLAVTVAGILLHPNFRAMFLAQDPVDLFSVPVTLADYGSTIIPILIMVWLMKYIELATDKIVPTILKSFVSPLIIIMVSGFLALVVIGPIGTFAGEGLSFIILWMQSQVGWLTLGIFAALMPLIILTGMHWAFAPIFLIASPAVPDILVLPAMLASNLSQVGVCFAVSLKLKNRSQKQVAFAAGITALFAGISEPSLYGVVLKYRKTLYAVMASSAICGVFMGIVNLQTYAFAVPSLVAMPQFMGDGGNTNIINAFIAASMALIISFVITLFIKIEDPNSDSNKQESKPLHVDAPEVTYNSSEKKEIYSPVTGQAIPLSQVKDDAFSNQLLGNGIAIIPQENIFVSPCTGVISSIAHSSHAIGLTSDDGVEVLIHVGIDTVRLDGKYFEVLIKDGDKVKRGQPILKADLDKIAAEGYDITTPVVIVNTGDYIDVIATEQTSVNEQSTIIYII